MAKFYSSSLVEALELVAPIYDGPYVDEKGHKHYTWVIDSDTSFSSYHVDWSEEEDWYCTCAGRHYKKDCKHIQYVLLHYFLVIPTMEIILEDAKQ